MALTRNASFWWALVIVWFCALFVVSSLSRLPPGPQIANFDKIEHTVFYALGGTCFYLARRFKNHALSGIRASLATMLFCMAVGAFDEFHQSFVPNRSGNDLFDWLADTLGGVFGSVAGWISFHILAQRRGR